jgi:hypothetical protein
MRSRFFIYLKGIRWSSDFGGLSETPYLTLKNSPKNGQSCLKQRK